MTKGIAGVIPFQRVTHNPFADCTIGSAAAPHAPELLGYHRIHSSPRKFSEGSCGATIEIDDAVLPSVAISGLAPAAQAAAPPSNWSD